MPGDYPTTFGPGPGRWCLTAHGPIEFYRSAFGAEQWVSAHRAVGRGDPRRGAHRRIDRDAHRGLGARGPATLIAKLAWDRPNLVG
jgi:hypothetical protein